MSTNHMAARLGEIRRHSANELEVHEGLFSVAWELIGRSLRVIEDDAPEDVAKSLRDTFKSEAQTFLDFTKPWAKRSSAADASRRTRR